MKLTQMNKENMKNFLPSQEMIAATESVFLNMAVVETIRPIVRGYQRKILLKHKMKYAKESVQKHFGSCYLTDPDHVYLLSDSDFKVYLAECRKEQEKARLKTDNPEHGPLLVAENNLRKAENLLMDSFEPLTGLKSSDINMRFDTRTRFLELTLSYMNRFVNSKRIMQGAKK